MTSIFVFGLLQFRYLRRLRALDREAEQYGIGRTDRRLDWWGNLAALEAARKGVWS